MEDDDLHQVVQLLEAFTSNDNDIREESIQQYQNFEQQDPENAIRILFKIISSNVSLNSSLQALIRLKLFLQNSVSSSPSISLEFANIIKTFILDYINKSTNAFLANYSLSIILDFYFKSFSNEEIWNGFFQYLIDLYPKEPCLALKSLTGIYDIYGNEDLISCICSFMNFDKEGELFVQSLISGLILIKHQLMFDGSNEFLGSFTKMLSTISDDDIGKPLEVFHSVFLNHPDPFSPFLEDILKYFLGTIADSSRNPFIRVQCMYIFSHIITINNEVRLMVISNPNAVTSVIASALSQPNPFIDIYKEARKGLKYILASSLDQLKVFDESLKEFGSSDNIYVKSVFLYHIISEQSLSFAFENVFHDDEIIRHNCLKIIQRMINADNESKFRLGDGETTLRDEIEDKVVDIFVEYLKRGNLEIYKFFITWCQCHGSKSMIKCIDPIVDLLSKKCSNEKIFIMASYLCKLYPEEAIMQEVASSLLEFSKKCIAEQTEDEIYLEVAKNLFAILDKESQENFVSEIIPYVFKSETLAVSLSFNEIIENLKDGFLPYLPNYLDILCGIAKNFEIKDVHITEIPENQKAALIVNTDHAIVISSVEKRNLYQMLQSFVLVIRLFPEFCRNEENSFTNIIKIINQFINFLYDDEIQASAIELCVTFFEKYITDPEIDIVLLQIIPIRNAINNTLDIINLSLFASVLLIICKNFKPEYVPHIESVIPLIFVNFCKTIQAIDEEGRYIDGEESNCLTQTVDSLAKCFENICHVDVHCASHIFYEITKIVPYFNSTELSTEIRYFISFIWAYFISFGAPEDLPDQQPDLLNDLFEFFNNLDDNSIKEKIIPEIGTLVYNHFPELSPSIIGQFEKIISHNNKEGDEEEDEEDDDDDISVKEAAIIQYALLLKKCDNEFFAANIDKILQLAQFFDQYSENIGLYCKTLINVAIFAASNSYDDQIIQKVTTVISSLIEQGTLIYYFLDDIVNECGDFEPLQPFKQSIQKFLKESNQDDQDNQDD